MRFAAFSRIAACIVAIICSFAPMTSEAADCRCRKNPGPGGGVQCAKDQIATCDGTSGECNCTCDSVQPGKAKADYQAQIFSKVLHTKVNPDELSSPQYQKYVSSFRKSGGDEGTFSFDKEAGASRGRQVTVGVPEWLEGVLAGKGGVSIGPGASLQNCPNGICIGGANSGTATVNNFTPPERHLTPAQVEALNALALSLPGDSVHWFTVEAVNVPECVTFGDEIQRIFKNRGKTDAGVVVWISGRPPFPSGVVVAVRDQQDEHFEIAQRIANSIVAMGLPNPTFIGGTGLRPGQVKIIIGLQ